MKKLRTALYGANGHQIYALLKDSPYFELAAAACIPESKLIGIPAFDEGRVALYESLPALLTAEKPDFICLCSPKRADQAKDAILCLEAGVTVYAEKPAALSERELDEILAVAHRTGVEFHEIADSAFFEPYFTMGKLIKDGKIGDVVQIYAQKSYPQYFPNRPADETTDGGLTRQAGIHAMRFIEHVAGVRVTDVSVYESLLGNRDTGELRMASSFAMKLENGGVASMAVNYLNPTSFGLWGNETLRVFGTRGMMEITDGGRRTHIYTEAGDEGEIDVSNSDCVPFPDLLARHLLFGEPLPMTEEEELHPLRSVLRAKVAAR